ncbi:MAG TPA: thioredoxin [Patescibacteria group bacterium]|nr:MAG: Thioredoxin [Candidatus Beckwithbacteria bacterium GW2011_GWA2_47_25]HLE50047.1 thioredoxin [Patescibacteria group bacterium]
MAAVHFSDADFEEKVLKSPLPVLVDFSAEWCGPCRIAAPIIDELAGVYAGKVTIGKLDVDESQGTAAKYGVMSIPTVIVFKGGKEVERKVGFAGKGGYEEMIKKVTG